ncbi:MAG: prepilin-type N-terminal cleavage/methylation domain-containing protein [Syntrophomonadaceae bacterium]|nr:prepilin-type N-terminal cleavage/methylation domain-containing protein [Syntrophomonadaceae bacterium]
MYKCFGIREKGFTLIELIVGMAVLSVLATLTVPRLNTVLDDMRLKADARELAQILRNARMESICSGEVKTVYFYPAANQYKAVTDFGEKFYKLREGISYDNITFTTNKCSFHPSGAASPAGTVKLQNKHGDKIAIIVSVTVGRVRVE